MRVVPKRDRTMAGDANAEPQPSIWDPDSDTLEIVCEFVEPTSLVGKFCTVSFSGDDVNYFLKQLASISEAR